MTRSVIPPPAVVVAAEWLMLSVGLLLTVGTGLFVASEFALVNLDRADLEARRDKGETRLRITIAALRTTSLHLSSAQLGITLTTLLTGFTMEPAISSLLRGPLTGLGMSEVIVGAVGTTTGIVVATLLSMIIGELVPKNFALALPRQTAKLVLPFQVAFTAVFRPAVYLLNESANGMLRAVGIEPKEELSGARSAEELSSLVRRSASQGALEADTATLLYRTLVFSEHTAADVMSPRTGIASVSRTDTAQDVIELTRTTGFSRFPVIDDGIDDVMGIVHVKKAVAVPREKRAFVPVSALQADPLRVPETMKLDTLLSELRGRGFQMAIVVDEYGGTAGIATLEDLVEELIGEVADEHDVVRTEVEHGDDTLFFSGMLRPDELLERTEITVPAGEDYETVAGFVMQELGRLPVPGDEVWIEGGCLRVDRLDGRRIDRIQFIAEAAHRASVLANQGGEGDE